MMHQPVSDFVDRLGPMMGMKLAVVEPLLAREGVCNKVEGNGEEMLLKFVDAGEGGPAVERRVRSFAEAGAEATPGLGAGVDVVFGEG